MINLALSDELLQLSGIRVIPGKKICSNCEIKLRKCVNISGNPIPGHTVCESFTEEVTLSTFDSIPEDMNQIATERCSPSTSSHPGLGDLELFSDNQIDPNNDKPHINICLDSEHSSDLPLMELGSDELQIGTLINLKLLN